MNMRNNTTKRRNAMDSRHALVESIMAKIAPIVRRAVNESKSADLRDIEISHGTLDTCHLTSRFLNALRSIDPDKYRSFLRKYRDEDLDDAIVMYNVDGDDSHPYWSTDDAQYMLDDLFDVMDTCSPEGCAFSASEGDGSSFGFWSYDNE